MEGSHERQSSVDTRGSPPGGLVRAIFHLKRPTEAITFDA